MPIYVHDLDELNPDDSRPPSQQIANLLRAAIMTGKLQPGERLPSQNELADRYGVARETIKAALRVLSQERLVISRQGSGAFVRAQTERPVGLRPHIEAAFERPHVSIDFAGFSGETLHGALSEPLDKIRAGRIRPESVSIRILLPDLTATIDVPKAVNAPDRDTAVRVRAGHISARAIESISDAVHELADLGLVKPATLPVEPADQPDSGSRPPVAQRRLRGMHADDREATAILERSHTREEAVLLSAGRHSRQRFTSAEVAGGVQAMRGSANELRRENDDFNAGLPRLACKMATGSGKTVVMAMIIAWQALNKLEERQDRRFSDAFLIVTQRSAGSVIACGSFCPRSPATIIGSATSCRPICWNGSARRVSSSPTTTAFCRASAAKRPG